jgi:hypothetical protein
MSGNDHYTVNGMDLSDVRNRNETRIVEKLREALAELGNPELPPKALRDAYALALNHLPARYTQSGTIVLREPIRESHLREAVAIALSHVLANPKL